MSCSSLRTTHGAVGLRHLQAGHGVQLVGEDGVPDLVHDVLPGRRRLGGRRRAVLAGRCYDGSRMLAESVGSVRPAAGWTSSTSTPPASFGWTKLTRLSAVPRLGAS